jgi:hypothetical protein
MKARRRVLQSQIRVLRSPQVKATRQLPRKMVRFLLFVQETAWDMDILGEEWTPLYTRNAYEASH